MASQKHSFPVVRQIHLFADTDADLKPFAMFEAPCSALYLRSIISAVVFFFSIFCITLMLIVPIDG